MNNMKNNIWVWVIGFIILALFLVFIARSGSAPKVFTDSFLVTEESSWDFGEISMANGDVFHSFVLQNNGNEAVRITKIQTSCMCTEASLETGGKKYGPFGMHGPFGADIEVAPNDTVIVKAKYDPNAHGPSGTGFISRSIYIDTNSAIKPKIELKFTANVIK